MNALVSILAALVMAGCGAYLQAPAAAPSARDTLVAPPEVYKIGPEDILMISVWKNDALTRTVAVRPDGKISFPLVNDVQAAGLSALELRDVLQQRLAPYIVAPEVAVVITEVRSLKVSVLGEVTRPGRFELKSWATVADALALAGGFTQFAARSRIVILRPEGTAMQRIPFNYNDLAGGQENYYLRNGDIILVP